MKKEIYDLKKENIALTNQITHKDDVILLLNTKISNSNKKNKSLKDKNKSLKDKNKELNKFKKEVLNSNSWKLTRPLRKISNLNK